MFGIVIDKQGYKVEFVVLNEDKSPQYYTLKDDETIVEDGWNITNSMNKPQLVNGEWVDTEPLPPIEPPIVEEDKITILEQQIITLETENLALKSRLDNLEQTLTGGVQSV